MKSIEEVTVARVKANCRRNCLKTHIIIPAITRMRISNRSCGVLKNKDSYIERKSRYLVFTYTAFYAAWKGDTREPEWAVFYLRITIMTGRWSND